MLLNVTERLLLLSLIPAEGTFANLKLLRVARERLSFTEEENMLLGFKQDGGKVTWADFIIVNKETGERVDPSAVGTNMESQINAGMFERRPAVEGKDIEIGEVVTQMVQDALKKLNDEAKLQEQHMTLYEKFVA